MKSYYLLFFLPLLIVNYSTANTVEPFHKPEESVNSQFYLPPLQEMMIPLSDTTKMRISEVMQ